MFYDWSVSQMRKCHWSEALIKKRIFMSCLTHSKFPLLKRLSDGGWISCMFVNIICSPLHPRGTCQSLKVSDSNANICLATEPEWDRLGHLHQRYSLVDRSHKVEFQRWNNGPAERGLGMQIPHCTHPSVKQSILINISCNENLLIRKKLKLFSAFPQQAKSLVCVFSDTCMCDVIFWATILEKWRQNILSGAHDSLSRRGPNMLKVQKHWDPQTIWHGCSHLSPFTNLSLCPSYLALCTLPPSRAHSTDSGWA